MANALYIHVRGLMSITNKTLYCWLVQRMKFIRCGSAHTQTNKWSSFASERGRPSVKWCQCTEVYLAKYQQIYWCTSLIKTNPHNKPREQLFKCLPSQCLTLELHPVSLTPVGTLSVQQKCSYICYLHVHVYSLWFCLTYVHVHVHVYCTVWTWYTCITPCKVQSTLIMILPLTS